MLAILYHSGTFWNMAVSSYGSGECNPLGPTSNTHGQRLVWAGVGCERDTVPSDGSLSFLLLRTSCGTRKCGNNLGSQNENIERKQKFLFQTCKLCGVTKLEQHCAEPGVGWMGGTSLQSRLKGSHFKESHFTLPEAKALPRQDLLLYTVSFVSGQGRNRRGKQRQEEQGNPF